MEIVVSQEGENISSDFGGIFWGPEHVGILG